MERSWPQESATSQSIGHPGVLNQSSAPTDPVRGGRNTNFSIMQGIRRPSAVDSPRSSDASARSSATLPSPASVALPSPASSAGTFVVRRGTFDSSSGQSSVFDSTSSSQSTALEPEESAVTEYRARVRRKLPSSYKGQRHLLCLIVSSSLGTFLPLLSWTQGNGSLLNFLVVVPATLVYANIVGTPGRTVVHPFLAVLRAELCRAASH